MDEDRADVINAAIEARRSLLESLTFAELAVEYTREFRAPPDPAASKAEMIDRMLWKLRLELQRSGP